MRVMTIVWMVFYATIAALMADSATNMVYLQASAGITIKMVIAMIKMAIKHLGGEFGEKLLSQSKRAQEVVHNVAEWAQPKVQAVVKGASSGASVAADFAMKLGNETARLGEIEWHKGYKDICLSGECDEPSDKAETAWSRYLLPALAELPSRMVQRDVLLLIVCVLSLSRCVKAFMAWGIGLGGDYSYTMAVVSGLIFILALGLAVSAWTKTFGWSPPHDKFWVRVTFFLLFFSILSWFGLLQLTASIPAIIAMCVAGYAFIFGYIGMMGVWVAVEAVLKKAQADLNNFDNGHRIQQQAIIDAAQDLGYKTGDAEAAFDETGNVDDGLLQTMANYGDTGQRDLAVVTLANQESQGQGTKRVGDDFSQFDKDMWGLGGPAQVVFDPPAGEIGGGSGLGLAMDMSKTQQHYVQQDVPSYEEDGNIEFETDPSLMDTVVDTAGAAWSAITGGNNEEEEPPPEFGDMTDGELGDALVPDDTAGTEWEGAVRRFNPDYDDEFLGPMPVAHYEPKAVREKRDDHKWKKDANEQMASAIQYHSALRDPYATDYGWASAMYDVEDEEARKEARRERKAAGEAKWKTELKRRQMEQFADEAKKDEMLAYRRREEVAAQDTSLTRATDRDMLFGGAQGVQTDYTDHHNDQTGMLVDGYEYGSGGNYDEDVLLGHGVQPHDEAGFHFDQSPQGALGLGGSVWTLGL